MKYLAMATLMIAAGLAGCRQEMRNDSRLKPFQESEFFADRNSARPMMPGTVPRGQANTDSFFFTGKINDHLVQGFPFPITKQELLRGQERYNIYCSVCHGLTGEGDGTVVQRGFPRPPSFHEDRLRKVPEGHFFVVMTNGYGAMYSYAARLSPADRWAVIAYIRALQLSRNSRIEDVPPQERAKLHGDGK